MTPTYKKMRKSLGFSLIEISIVILILSVTVSSSLNFLGKKMQATKNTSTRQRMNYIAKVLKVYANSAAQKVPCPAPINAQITDTTFGKSVSDCTVTASGVTKDATTKVVAGGLPFITIGLPAEFAFDEWGRRITYVMDADLSSTSNWGVSTGSGIPNINIANKDANGTEVTALWRNPTSAEVNTGIADCRTYGSNISITSLADNIPVCAAFVLISHGPDGYLAYDAKGNKISAGEHSTSTVENENANDNSIAGTTFNNKFYDLQQNLTTGNSYSYFDDILVYRSKDELKNSQ